MTINLRPANMDTIGVAWPILSLEAEQAYFAGNKCFAALAICNLYGQIPLDKDSRDAWVIIILPQATFTATRVLRGRKKATAHFREHISLCFQTMQQAIKTWLDGFIICVEEVDDLIKFSDQIFNTCTEYDLKLLAKKCKFFPKTVRWFGGIYDVQGYRLGPRNTEAMKNMEYPTTADEQCQFIDYCRWMANCIPVFHQIFQRLSEIL